jgi:hypothetical protein
LQEFFIEKVDDKFLEAGIKAFLEEDATCADLVIQKVYENKKHSVQCLLHEKELRVVLSN